MRIVYPYSFWLAFVVALVTCALTVAWNTIHVVALVTDVAAIAGLRSLALWEGRHRLPPPPAQGR